MEYNKISTEVGEGTPARERLRPQMVVFKDTLAYFGTMVLNWANEVNIPDIIHAHGQPIALPELVSKLSIPSSNAHMVRRLMRLLVHKGYFSYEKLSDAYSLTPLSEILIKGRPTNLSSWVHGTIDLNLISCCSLFPEFCQRDYQKHKCMSPYAMFIGKPFYEFANENPEFNTRFNEAMASDSKLTTRAMVEECKEAFKGLGSLVDVGGGTGTTARAIAEAFPHVKCSVYDLPHVIATAPKSPLVDAIGGDMFEHIPSADAVLLKLILHNWSDEECVKVLKLCKKAIPSKDKGGKVMIVDILMNVDRQEHMMTETQLLWDINMLAAMEGGKEREEHEWKIIFFEAGFSGYKIMPMGPRSLIEVFP